MPKKKIKPKATLDRKAWERVWRNLRYWEDKSLINPANVMGCLRKEAIQRIVNAEEKNYTMIF